MGDVVDCYDSADTAFYLVRTRVKFVLPSKTMYVRMYKLYFLDGVVVGVVSGWGWVWFQNVLFNVAYFTSH